MRWMPAHTIAWAALVALTPMARADSEPARQPSPRRASVLHVPHASAVQSQPLQFAAVVDDAWAEARLLLRYRPLGSRAEYRAVAFERSSAGGYYATIPAGEVTRPGIEYYIAGLPATMTFRFDGARPPEILHFASPSSPQPVHVRASARERWAESERRRLHGLMSRASFQVTGQSFGSRYKGEKDYYIRGELDWSHHILDELVYSISLGYGYLRGRTPESRGEAAATLKNGARYGYAGVRVRLHESVSASGRAILGVTHDGFGVGARGVVTFGKHWRSSVDLGAEYLQDLGPSMWIRLQWDTAHPLLMGATIMKTDLPGAELDNGSFVQWDVTYPVNPRLSVRGNLSFGTRDGPGSFGGGLGVSLGF